jgi:N-acetylglucosaminyldiphosphoundecaprenol N-acetyl-beta-D-mannosaminyltransferase
MLLSGTFLLKDHQVRMAGSQSALGFDERPAPRRFSVLGVQVDAVQIPDVITRIEEWIARRSASHFIAVTGMHGVVEAQHDEAFKRILNDADLVVPDGMPLVWVGRKCGHPLKRRVYGPELMETFCRVTSTKYRHFLYGGAPGVADNLAQFLHNQTGALIAGTYSPPFRPLSSSEDAETVKFIHGAAPDILWIGLSTPKQERWMYDHRKSLHVPAMVGVGAAFDLLTGKVKQAPHWMREGGLEWLFRLRQEPRRLWRRYLIYGSEFAWKASLEALGLKSFE